MLKRLSLSAAALLAATAPALAHLGPEGQSSFLAGFSHPLFGLDHILAMVAVGLWAAMLGGRAILIVPTAFVSTMAMGFALALMDMPLPFVEPAILTSVVILGLLVAAAAKLPLPACAALVGLFAFFHGNAHGGEIGTAGALSYGFGFLMTTTLLHLAGIAVDFLLQRGLGKSRRAGVSVSRILGAGTALAGVILAVG